MNERLFARDGLMRRLAVLLFVLAFSFGGSHAAFAQVDSGDVARRRSALQEELNKIEAEIAAQQTLLESKQRERVSLERDIAILDAQIEKAKLAIRARDIAIRQLTGEIGVKEMKIGELNSKLLREKQSLAQLIRKTNEIDDFSLVEILLSNKNLSDFFEELDSYDAVKAALQESFVEIEETKSDTHAEKTSLEGKRADELGLRRLQELQKREIELQEAEKQRILTATKGIEAEYQKLIHAGEKSAAEIRAELFLLRDSAAIPFGEALDLANFASGKTGVRPALLLAVLTQETRLGENLGTGMWTVDMHPTRDRPIFPYITSTLGLDPNRMPVSKRPSYGWGGAMGPAQFIPSTWVCYGGFINTNTNDCSNSARSLTSEAFWQGPWSYVSNKDRIRSLTGVNRPSNPWENRDAFMASAVLLMDNGAGAKTYSAERLAALRYFAGWSNATKAAYAFYGDQVMELADYYKRQIEILGES